jgi:hypothetical protein
VSGFFRWDGRSYRSWTSFNPIFGKEYAKSIEFVRQARQAAESAQDWHILTPADASYCDSLTFISSQNFL